MKIGLDIHGVIDAYPQLFSKLSNMWVGKGYEVHIVTGQEWEGVVGKVEEAKISYTHHFSIVDYHKSIATKMWDNDPRGKGWWMEGDIWTRSKGDYASRVDLDLHFDDSKSYAKYFPETCSFVCVGTRDFEKFVNCFSG